MKRKLLKLKNDLVLSIKYARLKEEISDTKIKKSDLEDKKLIFGSKDKAIQKEENFIEKAEDQIDKIEKKYKPKNYNLIVNNEFHDKLTLLSKYKNTELIKYSVAIETVLDDGFNYKNTDDFLENISQILFDNKNEIRNIILTLNKITNDFKGLPNTSSENSAINLLKMIPTKKISNVAKQAIKAFSLKTVMISSGVVGAAAAGFYGIRRILRKRKHTRLLSHLEVGDLTGVLTAYALNMTYARKAFVNNESGYRIYLQSTIKDINQQRINVIKDIFDNHFDLEQNQLKLELYYKFDNYFINLLKTIK